MPEIDSSLAPKGLGDLDTTVPMEKYKVGPAHSFVCVSLRVRALAKVATVLRIGGSQAAEEGQGEARATPAAA
jgi:hypothetical protein